MGAAAAADPWGGFMSGLGGGLGKGLGGAIGGDSGPTVATASMDSRSFMDGSGWTVSTGRSSATGGTSGGAGFGTGMSTLPTLGGAYTGGGGLGGLMVPALAGVVLWLMLRR